MEELPTGSPGKHQIANMYVNAAQTSQSQMVAASQFQDQDLPQFLVRTRKHNFAIPWCNRLGLSGTLKPKSRRTGDAGR